MRPLRATPVHYLLTPAQLEGREAFDPNGGGGGLEVALPGGAGAGRPRKVWTSLSPTPEAAPATRPPLLDLAFCPEGHRLAAVRRAPPEGRELVLWHFALPDAPASTFTSAVAATPPRAQLSRCAPDGLDVRLGAATLHWSLSTTPTPCATRGAEDAAQGRFADWVAAHGVGYDAEDEDGGSAHAGPLFAARACGAWQAALLEVALLYEHPVPGGGTRRRVHKHLRSADFGRALALWFYGDAVYWLTTDDDSAAGDVGRTDLWRLTLQQLARGLGGPEAHLRRLDCLSSAVELDPTGRFAAVMTHGRRTRRFYLVDCAALRPRFWRLGAAHGPGENAAAGITSTGHGAVDASLLAPPCALAFAPEGRHLLCWAPDNFGATPALFALPVRHLVRAPVARPLSPFAGVYAGDYALGPRARTLAHAPWQAGEAAVVVYDVAWPKGAASGAGPGAAPAALARRSVATSSR